MKITLHLDLHITRTGTDEPDEQPTAALGFTTELAEQEQA